MKKTIMAPCGKRQNGFTLMELIIVIVLLGIVGAMGAGFISQAFKGFFDTDIRMEMYEEGKSALVRMEREIHIAVPNAVQVFDNNVKADSGNEIQFGIIDEKAMAGVFGQYSEAHPTDTSTITDIKTTQLLQGTPLISIYNTTWDDFAAAVNRIYRVSGVAFVNVDQMTVNLQPPPAKRIGPASPYGRYYVVRPEAVRFRVLPDPTDFTKNILYRGTAQVNTDTALGEFGNDQILARNVMKNNDRDYFTYEPGTSTRNSVVSIHFAIQRNNEIVNFHKEVQVRNVP